jgi:hypothetical protein
MFVKEHAVQAVLVSLPFTSCALALAAWSPQTRPSIETYIGAKVFAEPTHDVLPVLLTQQTGRIGHVAASAFGLIRLGRIGWHGCLVCESWHGH